MGNPLPGISGVTVIGDFMRPDHEGEPGGIDRQIVWLHNAVRLQIGRAASIPTTCLTASTCPELRARIAALRPAYKALAHWAACFHDLPPESGLRDWLLPRLRGQFCIGYEMPPYLARLLSQAGVPFLDLRIHPVRFMDDLMFAARASSPETQAALMAGAVWETEVLATAGLRIATLQYRPHSVLIEDTLLVVGQRPEDATQIVDGAFFSAAGALPRIHEICSGYEAILLKAHPLDPHHSLLVAARATRAGVMATRENIYRLLARGEVTAILTVNSSVAYEAAYFGKTVHAIGALPYQIGWRDQTPPDSAYASLDDWFLTVDFWRLVLAPHARVTAPDGARLPAKPNRLRIAIDSFWNYQEIDTDLIPSAMP